MECEHGPCTCSGAAIERNGQMFCSEACANDAGGGGTQCNCTHDGCGGRRM